MGIDHMLSQNARARSNQSHRNVIQVCLLSQLLVALVIGSARGQSVADSFADFSGTQGQGGWYYGYYDGQSATPWSPSDFKPLTFGPDIDGGYSSWHLQQGPSGYWLKLRASSAHPNGTTTSGSRAPTELWAVRRWVSPFSGPVHIRGRLADLNAGCGNGVVGHVFVDGSALWERVIDNGTSRQYSIDASVNTGSVIDFALDPRQSDDLCDTTDFSAVIAPMAAVLADSFADFSGAQGQSGWYYGYYDGQSATPWSTNDFKTLAFFGPDIDFGGSSWHLQQGPGGYWLNLAAGAAHPNGTTTGGSRTPSELWAVRRWVSPFSGPVNIRGQLADLGTGCGNGVVGHVLIDGTEVWHKRIDDGDVAGMRIAIGACVNVGTVIDLALDPRASDDLCDRTAYTAQIEKVLISPNLDGDCDVDSDDLIIFQVCATGPAMPYDPNNLSSGCTLKPDASGHIAADFDSDGDVDQSDFGLFQRCYSGAGKPTDPNCAN